MRRIRRKDTKPEMMLRKELYRRGLRYRVDYSKAPGRPDIAIVGRKLAIFVDGEFWHGKKHTAERYAEMTEYWRTKIARNMDRDRRVNDELQDLGWTDDPCDRSGREWRTGGDCRLRGERRRGSVRCLSPTRRCSASRRPNNADSRLDVLTRLLAILSRTDRRISCCRTSERKKGRRREIRRVSPSSSRQRADRVGHDHRADWECVFSHHC